MSDTYEFCDMSEDGFISEYSVSVDFKDAAQPVSVSLGLSIDYIASYWFRTSINNDNNEMSQNVHSEKSKRWPEDISTLIVSFVFADLIVTKNHNVNGNVHLRCRKIIIEENVCVFREKVNQQSADTRM